MIHETQPAERSVVAEKEWSQTPPLVQECVIALVARLQELEAELTALRDRTSRNSADSSKHPFGNGPDTPLERRERVKGQRQRGSQIAHKGMTRKPVPPEQLKDSYDIRPATCRQCGQALEGHDPEPYRHQVTEIPPMVAEVVEYRLHALSCPECGATTSAELPPGVPRDSSGRHLQLRHARDDKGEAPLGTEFVAEHAEVELLGTTEELGCLEQEREALLDSTPLSLSVACRTDCGRVREMNQDYVEVRAPSDYERDENGYLFLVADGMGGHRAGEVASRLAVRAVADEYYATDSLIAEPAAALAHAVEVANNVVFHEANQNCCQAGMGTTITAGVIQGRTLYLANVGDSRGYLIRGGQAVQITQDHTWVAQQVRDGKMSVDQARDSQYASLLTRALGIEELVQVDLFSRELHEGDVILLCSDGLTRYVDDDELPEQVSTQALEPAVSRLISLANERGGGDNISVVAVRVTT